MIRRATLEDLDNLRAIIDAHIATCKNATPRTDTASVARSILAMFHHTSPGIVLLAVSRGTITGVACAIASPYLWADGVQAEIRLVLVVPEFRGGRTFPRLMAALDQWAREKECVEISFALATGSGDDRLAAHLEARGWTRTGIDMVRALS